MQGALLSITGWVGSDSPPPEVVKHLPWHFFKCFLGKQHRVILELTEGHKLDDVSSHLPLVFLGIQGHLICIQLVHGREVSATYSDYND